MNKNKKELPKNWEPQKFEDKIYKKWEESGFFNPDNLNLPEDAPSYTIVLPPPNITDKLHVGHSSMLAIEDLMIRFKRMNGFRTLWVPGTDHAAIATQNVVEKRILKEEGKTRHDLGKEKFMKKAWEFMKETQGTILMQTRKMGASLDWSREAFTLDEKRKKAVQKMFIAMYEAGVIYRGERIVNWCPRCHSTLADDEVEHKEEQSKLYWIKYGPFIVATSRPETKLGDTAVAVHPKDERYKDMIGKEYDIPGVLGDFKIKVVADRAVDPEFGSGAIKVTPAHSFVDNEIAERHNLPIKKIIDEDGKMMENCGKYAGMTTLEAREQIVADMEKMGLIDHIEEDYIHNTSQCYRCDSIIEPIMSKQWFVDVDKKLERFDGKSLKERAIEVAKSKEVKFIPNRFTKRYLHWMENLHDWCISRQIWLGHEIPVWHKITNNNSQLTINKDNKNQEIYVGENAPEGDDWKQDPDTLDTWFSSGMWTFSTLGWPDENASDLKNFHPTQVLETGYEILTLWVSRMIMMSLFAVNEIPFENVYLHGMVLDAKGKKMSKSKGNGIDPLDVIEKYGTDAVRLSLLIGNTPGNDLRMSEEKIEGYKKFVNKLWNISRFVFGQIESDNFNEKSGHTMADLWILKKFKNLTKEVTDDIENYKFSQAGEKLRVFTWDDFADWYLEISKIEKNPEKKVILRLILQNILKLWHPFTPFVTEEIWKNIDNQSLLMVSNWPKTKDIEIPIKTDSVFKSFSLIQKIITAIRSARAQYSIAPNKKIDVTFFTADKEAFLLKNKKIIQNLQTGIENIEIKKNSEKITNSYYEVIEGIEIYIHLEGVIEIEKEKKRMSQEIQQKEKLIEIISKKLSDNKFIENAPKKIIEQEKRKLELIKDQKEKIRSFLQNLK